MGKSVFLLSCLFLLSTACTHNQKKTSTETSPTATKESNEKTKTSENKTIVDEAITCKVNNDQRVISLDKQPHRCEVHYTKHGEKSQVAWAEATPSICTDVMEKIRTNIESKGYKCISGNQEHLKTDKTVKEEPKTAKRDTASQNQ